MNNGIAELLCECIASQSQIVWKVFIYMSSIFRNYPAIQKYRDFVELLLLRHMDAEIFREYT